jgi:glycosyltransferase involved in cell wall biosynthesis
MIPAAGEPLHLSLVVPVYNGAHYVAGNVRTILDALAALDAPFELVVVCDGSSDGTAERAAEIDDERVRVLRCAHNGGKGEAVVRGIQSARGRLVGWLDGDLDVDPEAIVEAVRRFDAETLDAVIGSKRHPDSRVVYPARRRLYSWGYQMLVRLLFRVNVRDTQVGAKVFRREMLETVTPLMLVKRYAFDLEMLAIGAEFGFDRIEEVPIALNYRFSGSLINHEAVKRMLIDTLAIAYRIHIRHHYVRRFAALQRQRVDLEQALAAAPPPAVRR